MGVIRVLIDGYSLLHACPELCGGKPPHSETARDALFRLLQQYHDATGIPITVFYDGAGVRVESAPESTPGLEVVFSSARQTADQLIERVAYRLVAMGEVIVVTNDVAESNLVRGFGCTTVRCEAFLNEVEETLNRLRRKVRQRKLAHHDRFSRRVWEK